MSNFEPDFFHVYMRPLNTLENMIFKSCVNIHGALFLAAGRVSGGQIKGAQLPRLPVWSGSGTVFSHLIATFSVGHCPKNPILSLPEEKHSENHFFIKSFTPCYDKYVLSDSGRKTV